MRRHAIALPLVALAALAPIVPACSSSPSEAPGVDAGGEAATIPPEQLQGQPCNPLLSDPCYPVLCAVVTCDPVEMTCEATPIVGPCHTGLDDGGIVFEASTIDAPVVSSSSCTDDEQCPPIASAIDGAPPTVQVCAFSAFDSCSASGVCVVADPPLKLDGAVDTACGCNGQPVQYVTDTQTAAPVSSPAPCSTGTDAGTDATAPGPDGGAATDAAVDASSDASDGG